MHHKLDASFDALICEIYYTSIFLLCKYGIFTKNFIDILLNWQIFLKSIKKQDFFKKSIDKQELL